MSDTSDSHASSKGDAAPPRHFGDLQNPIYTAGIHNVQPRFPFLYSELKQRAREVLDPRTFSYVAGGAGDGLTQTKNAEAFFSYGITPRMLRDRSHRDLSVTVFGHTLPSPIYVAPVGVLGAVYPGGDLETAKAASSFRIPVLCSTLSDRPMEETREAARDNLAFFQLYPAKDRELCDGFVHRAMSAGFDALVITVDGVLGWRPHDLRLASIPMHYGQCLANYRTQERFLQLAGVTSAAELTVETLVSTWDAQFADPTFSWDDVRRIRAMVDKPLLLKGICTPEDARKAVDLGVDGIICSNHGGREANGGVPALENLPAVRDAIPDTPVLFDSGVRTGVDVLKALALGATMVGIGRPYVYGLALGGQAGVEFVLRNLLAEADLNLASACYESIADLRSYGLRTTNYHSTRPEGWA